MNQIGSPRVQQEQAAHQYHQQFRTWSGEEDAKFTRAHPEMADNATASGVMQRTRSYVHQKGFSDDRYCTGLERPSAFVFARCSRPKHVVRRHALS